MPKWALIFFFRSSSEYFCFLLQFLGFFPFFASIGDMCILSLTRSPQGLYNWAACDVTNPNLSPLLSFTFQVISGTSQIFRLLSPRDKKRYYATQYFNFSVTLLRYGLKILTDSWIEGDSLGYLDHPPRRCHPGRQPTFIHFFTNTLKCLHGRLAG